MGAVSYRSRLGAALLAACLGGALAPARAMDLRAAYEAALVQDATIRAARAAADATRERLPQALAQRLPNISANASYHRNNLDSTTPDMLGRLTKQHRAYDSSNVALVLRQPIYRPALAALVRQAHAQVDNAQALLESDEQGLLMRLGQAYFEALQAREQLALAVEQIAIYRTQVDAADKRWKGGAGVRTDVDEAQARLDLAIAQELEAQQALQYHVRRLESMTGEPVAALGVLDTERFAPEGPAPASLDDWVRRAEQASAELRALQAQLAAAEAEIDKAQAGHKPTLDAVAQWSRSESDNVTSVNSRYDNKTIGLQLTVPLYAGGYVNSTVREAVALRERAREMLEAARLDLALRVRTEFRNMTEGVLRIRALEQAVRSAEQMVHSNRESFKAGVRTTLDVLNAEQQKMAALRDLAQARHGYALARLRLHALAGVDRSDNVAAVNAWLRPGDAPVQPPAAARR